MLDVHATFAPVQLAPEISAFQAHSLVEVWEAAEALAGATLPAPFWAFTWPAGCALARVLLDLDDIAGARVLDIGAGGGVASIAAAKAGAHAVANDIDAWALLTARIAAERQGLTVDPLHADCTREPERVDGFDIVVAADLQYERRHAPEQRDLLARARNNGARVLLADAGRTYFQTNGLTLLAQHTVDVPQDVEGVTRREARVYSLD